MFGYSVLSIILWIRTYQHCFLAGCHHVQRCSIILFFTRRMLNTFTCCSIDINKPQHSETFSSLHVFLLSFSIFISLTINIHALRLNYNFVCTRIITSAATIDKIADVRPTLEMSARVVASSIQHSGCSDLDASDTSSCAPV